MDKWKWGAVYFAVLGAVTVWFGCWELATSYGITEPWAAEWLKLFPEGMDWMCLWRGLVTFLAGLLIMWGAFRFSDVEGFGTSVIGTMMLWIAVGCDILKMFCGSLSGEGSWSYSFYGFLKYYAPPYPAATWLLPFSLVMLYFIVSWGKEKEKSNLTEQKQKEREASTSAKESISSTRKEGTI